VTAPSVVEAVGAGRIMRDLLADRTVKGGLTNCANPAHEDKNPSMSVDLDGGVFNCFACGVQGGVLDLAVLRGRGRDLAEAAAMLAEQYHVGNGHAPQASPVNEDPFPYFPRTAESIGWGFEDGRLRVPTWKPDGTPGRTKLRGGRGPDGKLSIAFENDADDCGLVNLPALTDHSAGVDHPKCALVCGETDLLAWTYYAKKEGIDVPAVSHSTGEGASLKDFAAHFRGVEVYYFPDDDEAGRKQRPLREAELRAAGATVRTAHPPAPHKDVRAYLSAGGTVRDLMRLAETPEPAVVPDSWDLSEVIDEPDEPVRLFVDRLFVRPSFNVVFGPPQAGKSWAVMALCLDAVMGGGCFLGAEDLQILPFREIRDGKPEVCLWIFGSEDTKSRVKRRLKTLLASGPHAGKSVPKGAFIIATPPGGMSIHMPAGMKWVEEKIKETGATIVVMDTIASLTGATLDVNKAEQVVPFIAWINGLRTAHDLVIHGLHHTRKGSSDAKKSDGTKADAMLGAGAWRALSESCLMLDAPDGDTSKVTVRSIKAKDIDHPIPPMTVTLESPGGRFRVLEEDEQPAEREKAGTGKGGRPKRFSAESVLALKAKFPFGLDWSEATISKALDIGHATWFDNQKSVLSELTAAGCSFTSGKVTWPA